MFTPSREVIIQGTFILCQKVRSRTLPCKLAHRRLLLFDFGAVKQHTRSCPTSLHFSTSLFTLYRFAGPGGKDVDEKKLSASSQGNAAVSGKRYVPPHMRGRQQNNNAPPSSNSRDGSTGRWGDFPEDEPPRRDDRDDRDFRGRGFSGGSWGRRDERDDRRAGGGGGGSGAFGRRDDRGTAPRNNRWNDEPPRRRKDGPPPPRDPDTEARLFGDITREKTGINFEKYNDIPVEFSAETGEVQSAPLNV